MLLGGETETETDIDVMPTFSDGLGVLCENHFVRDKDDDFETLTEALGFDAKLAKLSLKLSRNDMMEATVYCKSVAGCSCWNQYLGLGLGAKGALSDDPDDDPAAAGGLAEHTSEYRSKYHQALADVETTVASTDGGVAGIKAAAASQAFGGMPTFTLVATDPDLQVRAGVPA